MATPLKASLPLMSSIQEIISNNFLMTTRKNMIIIVISKSNKITDSSSQHIVEGSSTSPLKSK
jgi:hypothetical protein